MILRQSKHGRGPAGQGFTLVEILIVVMILAILAAIVLPKFSNASAIARASMLADDLRIIRMQVQVYRSQHNEVPPGYPDGDRSAAPTEEAFAAQMTRASDRTSKTAQPGTPGYDYGPYLREVPTNPLNGKRSVQIIADGAALPVAGDDTHGWVFQPATQLYKSDSPGTDDKAKLYFEY